MFVAIHSAPLMHTPVGIYHSEELYDEPLVFRPERYLESEFGTKPGADTAGLRLDLHFGSGRVEYYCILEHILCQTDRYSESSEFVLGTTW